MNRIFIKNSINILLLSGFVALTSCEPDDICLADEAPFVTTQLRYSDGTTELKDTIFYQAFVNDTVLIGQGSNNGKSTFNLPIQITENKTIKYVLQQGSNYRKKIEGTDEYNEYFAKTDVMYVSYNIDNKYDSKACGFGVIFNNATITTSNNWIINSQLLNPSIDDATSINFILIAEPRNN